MQAHFDGGPYGPNPTAFIAATLFGWRKEFMKNWEAGSKGEAEAKIVKWLNHEDK